MLRAPEAPLHGQTTLVTGASRGIGRAVCERLAELGARVAVHCHRDRAAAESVRDKLPGGPHLVVQGDIGNADAVTVIMNQVVAATGRLDVLVNNAAVAERHPILSTDFAEWQRVWHETINANLIGPSNTCYLAAKIMVEQGGGRIINISSRGAFRGEPAMPAYGASKAGLNALSQSLAKALAPHGVIVTVVAPGYVATERILARMESGAREEILADQPLGRIATPEEVAYTVGFLASADVASISGAIIDVNGASYLR